MGINVSFNVVAAGTAPLSYQWQFNGPYCRRNWFRADVDQYATCQAGTYDVR